MNILARYLAELRKVRSAGAVPETSYYPALAELITSVGSIVSPKVKCIVHPVNLGAGSPDMALFSHDQLPSGGEPLKGVLPACGVIEAKGTATRIDDIVKRDQVARYLKAYGIVLVTNLRDFVLVERGVDGELRLGERHSLASDEAEFWTGLTTDAARDALFVNYLKRVLLAKAPIVSPKDLAWLLASYAREAMARIETSDLDALAQLRESMEEALGIHFKDKAGDHFFRSTLVQTLFYGIFSAWVLWHRSGESGAFDWRKAAWYLRVPMIAALFHQASDPSKLEPLGLVEVLDWTGEALKRVERGAFFERFEADHAVQYFYEPFLEAFDPVLRRELGVWYTPREIVRYQVARVDTVLREELGVAAGLADPSVVVLDPCCGTGAYLVEVLRLIHRRIAEEGVAEDNLALNNLKVAATERVFGFEILPAPFVVAHLQLGLLLHELGASLNTGATERVGVYLTNSLTGWDGDPPQKGLIFPELLAERDAASKVKRDAKILVILGNPPYNGFAGIAVDEERALSDAYRTTKEAPKPQGQGLNDLYVRFFRMAERRIVEQTGAGVVCFISNSSWLDGLSFPGMRERFIEVFDKIWIDNCNGDKYRTGKVTPEGKPDPSVFSTQYNREGIQVGTAIATLVRATCHVDGANIGYREFWGKAKLEGLEAARDLVREPQYVPIEPPVSIGLPMSRAAVAFGYASWNPLPDLFAKYFPGVQTSRDDLVVDIDRDCLEKRIGTYFNPTVSHDDMARLVPSSMESTARFAAESVREKLRLRGVLNKRFIPHSYRPFDSRWLYWEPETKLIDEKRADYAPHVMAANPALAVAPRFRREYDPPYVTSRAGARHLVESGASLVPLKLATGCSSSLFDAPVTDNPDGTNWNLSDDARAYLTSLNAPLDSLFYHALAVMHSPAYRTENAGALRQDWPRIPLPGVEGMAQQAPTPGAYDVLLASAALGRRVAALLDSETSVAGVTEPPARPELRAIASLVRVDGKSGIGTDDLAVTAGWGNKTTGGVMPGKGKLTWRDAAPDAAPSLGAQACDVYLNDNVYWKSVPEAVWRYTLGGYQVLKKWLSYRERGVLGRALKTDEALHFQQTARRIAALILLGDELDANYAAVKAATGSGNAGNAEAVCL